MNVVGGWFYFKHIPNTEGTSIRYTLYHEFGLLAVKSRLCEIAFFIRIRLNISCGLSGFNNYLFDAYCSKYSIQNLVLCLIKNDS